MVLEWGARWFARRSDAATMRSFEWMEGRSGPFYLTWKLSPRRLSSKALAHHENQSSFKVAQESHHMQSAVCSLLSRSRKLPFVPGMKQKGIRHRCEDKFRGRNRPLIFESPQHYLGKDLRCYGSSLISNSSRNNVCPSPVNASFRSLDSKLICFRGRIARIKGMAGRRHNLNDKDSVPPTASST